MLIRMPRINTNISIGEVLPAFTATGVLQGVATDGVFVYTSSTSPSVTVYKYDLLGNLVTSRTVSGDSAYAATHIGGMCCNDGFLYVGTGVGTGCVLKLNSSDLSLDSIISTDGNHDGASIGRDSSNGDFWIVSYTNVAPGTPASIYKYDSNFLFQSSFQLKDVGSSLSLAYDGVEVYNYGNLTYLILNVHESTEHPYIDIYLYYNNSLTRVQSISHFFLGRDCGQDISINPLNRNELYIVDRTGTRILKSRIDYALNRNLQRFLGGSTKFDGTNSYISNTLTLPETGSVSVRFKLSAMKDFNTLFDTSADANRFEFWVYSNGRLGFHGTSATLLLSDAGKVKKDRWHNGVVTWTKNGYARIYLDALNIGTSLLDVTTFGSGTTFYWGGGVNTKLNGYLSEGKIYNQELTQEQITKLYTTGNCDVTPIADYPLDDQPSDGYRELISGNNGTGTATTYSMDTPVQARVAIDNNAKSSLYTDGGSGKRIALPALGLTTGYSFATKIKSTGLNPSGYTKILNINGNNVLLDQRLGYYQANGISGPLVKLNRWVTLLTTYDGTTQKIYLDGNLVVKGETSYSPVDGAAPNSIGGIDDTQRFIGYIKEARIWNSVLTDTEVRNLHFNNIVPRTNLVGEWLLNEGAGTIAYDTSGNGNNGTITGATWSAETPPKARELMGGNLVPNGFLTNVPPFVAETTNSGGVIVGQAAVASHGVYGVSKSEQSKIFRWSNDAYNVTNPKFRYVEGAFLDGSNAIKMSFTDVKERVNLRLAQRNYPDLNNPDDIRLNCIPVLPNTSYTFSVKGKLVVSSKTGNPFGIGGGFYMYAYEHTPSGAVTMRKVTFLESDTNEITRSITFTTGANTRFINIGGGAYGNATDYWSGEVYVGNIYLNKTTPDTRTVV